MGLLMVALLAAVPVHAEMWALWPHGIYRSGAEEWQRVQKAATEADCWASFASLKLTAVDAEIVRTVVEGYTITAYNRDGTKYVAEFSACPTAWTRAGRRGSEGRSQKPVPRLCAFASRSVTPRASRSSDAASSVSSVESSCHVAIRRETR